MDMGMGLGVGIGEGRLGASQARLAYTHMRARAPNAENRTLYTARVVRNTEAAEREPRASRLVPVPMSMSMRAQC